MSVIGAVGQMGLQALVNEPMRLKQESDRCNEELEALVMENYRVFIENLTCSVELRQEDQKLSKVYNNLSGNLDHLSSQCGIFKEKVSSFITNHKRNRKTLQHHMQLVELLEVPQLVDACARNGFHDEALELANFVNGLERRHLLAEGLKGTGGSTTSATTHDELKRGSIVIQSIVGDVHAALLSLRRHLIGQLSEETSLPKELQALATLRKLDALFIDRQLSLERHDNPLVQGMDDGQRAQLRAFFIRNSETRLQLEYLEARTMWMHRTRDSLATASVLKNGGSSSSSSGGDKDGAISSGDATASGGGMTTSRGPYPQAIELLDAHRSAWFNVVTEYRALFDASTSTDGGSSGSGGQGDASSSSSTGLFGRWGSSASSQQPSIAEAAAALSKGKDLWGRGVSAGAILTAWFSTQLHELLAELEVLCACMDDGNALRATLEQALFFAARMGDVGFDFTASLLPIFRNVVLLRVSRAWNKATEEFKTVLATERFIADGTNKSKSTTRVGSGMQVVPLYLQQAPSGLGLGLHNNTNSGGAGGGGNSVLAQAMKTPVKSTGSSVAAAAEGIDTSVLASEELPAPTELPRYPPLAFLANALLAQLNFLRECPLQNVQIETENMLGGVLKHVGEHLAAQKGSLDERGGRYLAGEKGGAGAATATETATMSTLYARAFAFELAPHVLSAFDCVYRPNNIATRALTQATATAASASGGGNNKRVPVSLAALRVERLMDAQTFLSPECYSFLHASWQPLMTAQLLEEKALTPSPVPQKGGNAAAAAKTGAMVSEGKLDF
jgi:hypothetical protein